MNIFDHSFSRIEQALDYSMTKNRVISNNVANLDTPNYKAKDVSFKSVLEGKLQAKRTHEKHIPFEHELGRIQVLNQKGTVYNHNGNNVDIDREMSELAKNQILYQSLVDRLNHKFSDLQSVLRGGN